MRPGVSLRVFLCFAAGLIPSFGQLGDHPGEVQKGLPLSIQIPPAPVLSPAEELRTFKLPPGFRIELVASEPMVDQPVAISFDAAGRLWVVEMRGYMPNLNGTGEDQPVGQIRMLEDTDGDGRMDKQTVFLSGLVLPRALAMVRDGVLVGEPPHLWFCRDTDGDGKADQKEEIANDYGNPANVEHTANGLLWAMDNWIYSANYSARFRNVDGGWQKAPAIFRGQWGITQDDFGRLFYNSNSDQLRGDLVPAEATLRNPHYAAGGANVQIAADQRVWPGRVNPGVNRGYQKWQLQENGRLATYTAACAPLIYRGDNFPPDFEGNAFVCEPAGNLVRRNVLIESNSVVTARNAYDHDEFLTSTDERFRPVNLANGPDGALYLVDMYHGIIQHKLYITSFLHNQILARNLDQGVHRGRIYRIVYSGKAREPQPVLSLAGSEELVRALFHPNGWRRDMAQQLLVQRRDPRVLDALRQSAAHGPTVFGRLQALWTLEGIGALGESSLIAGLADPHPKIRAAAIRLSESYLHTGMDNRISKRVYELLDDSNSDVQLQLALSLGEATGSQAERSLVRILEAHFAHRLIRDAVLASIPGRELEVLTELLQKKDWNGQDPGQAATVDALAKAVFAERKPERVETLLALAEAENGAPHWRQLAIADGISKSVPPLRRGQPPLRVRPVQLTNEPALFKFEDNDPQLKQRLVKIKEMISWPGKPGGDAEIVVPKLTPDEKKRFDEGKELYAVTCGACHQLHGNGQEGLAPPLAESEWVLGPAVRIIRIALQGVRGPITVKGKTFELEMPPLGILSDEHLANILTYVRRGWENTAEPISVETIAKVRDETSKREEAWTEKELLKVR